VGVKKSTGSGNAAVYMVVNWTGSWVWWYRRGHLLGRGRRVFRDDFIYRFERIAIDLLFAEVHAALGVEAVERGQAQGGVGDMDKVYWIFVKGIS